MHPLTEQCSHRFRTGLRCRAYRVQPRTTCWAHTRGSFGGRVGKSESVVAEKVTVVFEKHHLDVIRRWQHERGKKSLGAALRDLLETLDAQKVD